MLFGFDHVTIVVNDLELAVRSYALLLGAAPTWRGTHPELGTQVALFGLRNSLIELVGPIAGAPEAEGLRALLQARGEGLHTLAFSTDAAAISSKALRERGLRATLPEQGTAHALDGSERSYQTVELSSRSTRGLQVLAVQRSDTAVLRGPWLESTAAAGPVGASAVRAAEAVDALDHVVIRSADLEAALALYGRGLGLRLALERELAGKRMLFFRIGGVTIEVVEHPEQGATDALHGVAYRVRDIDAAHARLLTHGLTLSAVRDGLKAGTRVFSVRSGSCGVPTLMVRDPSRD